MIKQNCFKFYMIENRADLKLLDNFWVKDYSAEFSDKKVD